MTLVTIYALFFDDIRILFVPKRFDDYFYGITVGGIVLYTIEIVLSSLILDDYFLGFFFWLDVVSTVSMVGDVGWIW
mgnify:CR=1 FL=1